jgi:hypothetical protein
MPGAREGWSSASSHRHSLRQLNWKRSGGGGGNSSCGDLPSSAAAGPPLVKHSALYGDPCPLCRPGAAGSLSAPLGGCESRVRAGDGPEAAAEVDNGGVRADGGGAAVEAGIGGDGSRAGGGRLVHGARATTWGSESNAAPHHVTGCCSLLALQEETKALLLLEEARALEVEDTWSSAARSWCRQA